MYKRVKKLGIAAAFSLLSAGIMAGCMKNTPSAILKEAVENSAKVSSYASSLEIGMNMGVKQSGISMNLEIGMDMDVEFTNKPREYHANGSINLGIMDMSLETELYGIQNEDENKLTTYANLSGQWIKVETDEEESSAVEDVVNLEKLIDKGAELKLEKDAKEDGKEVYVITTKIAGEKLNTIQDFLGKTTGETVEKVDFSDLEGDATIKIDKKTRLPVSFSMEFNTPSGKGVSVENDGVEVTLDNFTIATTFHEYDTIDKISLPEEALDAIEMEGDSANDILNGISGDDESYEYEKEEIETDGNGNYIVKDYSDKKEVLIAPIAGMELRDTSDAYYASFSAEGEDSISVRYSVEELDEYYTEEDLINYQKEDQQYYTETEEYSDIVFEDVKTVAAGAYEMKYTSLSYTYNKSLFGKEYQAWILTDDGFAVVCSLSEEAFDEPGTFLNEEKIVEIMSGIKE